MPSERETIGQMVAAGFIVVVFVAAFTVAVVGLVMFALMVFG